ncbi:type VI secretion system baseplate subunit TssF [Massilia horti]|uniref:Type VI secretion system baseplate subunit TssF n=1 Tax=Massilia horti TaxID=2562153 RepID=A0A4Y9T5T7_9BURK|nr:type VI secretion system baseplate subunit TssF [Massilia horti]TFW33903.1 type VI secretion system baseplate subunit TssF [Massilia horti]
MNPQFYDYYNQELVHVREMAAEFAREFPKIAGRLALDGTECADPYVERLLEGFAFMAARVQLKLDAEFPAFVQHLAEVVFPGYLAPVPPMTVVRFDPDMDDAALLAGVPVPRGTVLRGGLGEGAQTRPEFRTAHPVVLWPLQVLEAKLAAYPPELPRQLALPDGIAGALHLRLRLHGDASFSQLPLDELVFHLAEDEGLATRLYEHLFAGCLGVVLGTAGKPPHALLGPGALQPVGFSDDEALLPPPARSLRGYRLLREYAAFPARFLFFRLAGLRAALAGCHGRELDIIVLLGRVDSQLEPLVDARHFSLHATPAVNLFTKRLDRIHLDARQVDYHVVPDRARPLDFEVFQVNAVSGFTRDGEGERQLRALYASIERDDGHGDGFYVLRREARVRPVPHKRQTPDRYIGTEVFVSLVETAAPPFGADLAQLSVEALCSNRDLAQRMPVGLPRGDFAADVSLPVTAIRCLRRPSAPVPPALDGACAWKVISHLSLNYLSLNDTSPVEGAVALRQMLELYGLDPQSAMRKQLEGIRAVRVAPVVRRVPARGPVTMGRGLEIELTCDERSFEGSTPFLLASVLEQFFTRHAAINSFTETVLRTSARGEIMRWKPRFGQRPVL